jgi:hypothetical protein
MTVPDRVKQWLHDHKGFAYCDSCIRDDLELSRPQQVQQVTSALAGTHGYGRFDGICYECGESRTVIGWRLNSG